jgi:microcystin degradation protein MlrC
MLTGQEVDLGDTALIDIDGVIVSLVSRFAFAVDEDAFSIFGLRPQDFDVIVLRSKTHFRAVYEEIAEEIVIVDTPDWGTSELKSLPYRFLDKSNVYPLWLGDEES